jgi:hypothetical protein
MLEKISITLVCFEWENSAQTVTRPIYRPVRGRFIAPYEADLSPVRGRFIASYQTDLLPRTRPIYCFQKLPNDLCFHIRAEHTWNILIILLSTWWLRKQKSKIYVKTPLHTRRLYGLNKKNSNVILSLYRLEVHECLSDNIMRQVWNHCYRTSDHVIS